MSFRGGGNYAPSPPAFRWSSSSGRSLPTLESLGEECLWVGDGLFGGRRLSHSLLDQRRKTQVRVEDCRGGDRFGLVVWVAGPLGVKVSVVSSSPRSDLDSRASTFVRAGTTQNNKVSYS